MHISRRFALICIASLASVAAAQTNAPVAAPVISAASAPATVPRSLYGRLPRSEDGIGKRYMGREIAGVMGWQGAAWLERDEREQEERGDLLLRELALKPGMVVADIGAGTGYYARRMAPLVGSSGQVLAVDVQPQMIEMLTAAARKAGLTNIKPILSTVDNVTRPMPAWTWPSWSTCTTSLSFRGR